MRRAIAIFVRYDMILAMKSSPDSERLNPRRVDVLDGLRALAILVVMWYHIWQQSWLMPVFRLPFLARLGLSASVSLDFIPRSGFIFVDFMLLLSAFCLFLPHARAMLLGEAVPDIRVFYRRRALRILPPYLLCIFVIVLAWAIPTGAFGSARKFCTDFFSTLSFTQTFFPTTLLGSSINGVLWTAAVEVQFYLIFPFLAWCFRRRPLITYLLMLGLSVAYIRCFALPNESALRVTTNQLPAFFGVFANGMLAAYAYVFLSVRLKRRAWLSAVATVLAVAFFILIGRMEKSVTRVDPVQVWQLNNRFILSLAFCGLIFSAALSAKWFRWLFSNRVMRFFAAISYNIYIWHQWLAVRFVEWRIPYWSGDVRPNIAGDRAWQWGYTALVTLASFAVAALITYGFEKPIAKILSAPHARETEENDEKLPV